MKNRLLSPIYAMYQAMVCAMAVTLFIVSSLVYSQESDSAHSATDEIGEYYGAKATSYPDWFKDSFLDLKEDVDEAAEDRKQLLVLFSQDNCPYCHELITEVYADAEVEAYLRENFDVVHLNIWGSLEVLSVDGQSFSEKEFAEANQVQFTPTTMLYDAQGNQIKRINGYRGKENYLATLQQASGKDIPASDTSTAAMQQNNQNTVSDLPEVIAPYETSADSILIDQPTALFIYASGCADCDAVVAVMRDEQIWPKYQQLNITAVPWESNPEVQSKNSAPIALQELVGEQQLGQSPTLIFLDENGSEIIRIDAIFKTFHMNGIVDYVLTKAYLEQPNFQRYLSEKADKIRETGEDVNIWQ